MLSAESKAELRNVLEMLQDRGTKAGHWDNIVKDGPIELVKVIIKGLPGNRHDPEWLKQVADDLAANRQEAEQIVAAFMGMM